MAASVFRYLRAQHLGLIALVLVIAGGSAYAAGLSKNSVKSKQIKNGAVKSVDVQDQGLTATDIADGTLGAAELGASSVGSAAIVDGSVGASELADDAVGQGKISDGAINSAKIADGSVSSADLDPASVADDITSAATTATDGTLRPALVIPGIGTLENACPGNSHTLMYTPVEGPTEVTSFYMRNQAGDLTVNRATSFPSSVSIASPGATGSLWIESDNLVARVEISLAASGGSCRHFMHATVDRNEP